MCVVSMVGDFDYKKILFPSTDPNSPIPPIPGGFITSQITREEFEQLKREVEDLKKLLQKAKEYDEKNNEPNCEIEEKMKFLKQVAAWVGVDLNEILKNNKNE